MRICGFNKTTLLDYPGKVASTIFLGGCNFRCPFCQNGILVVAPGEQPDYSQEELLTFLKKRKGILDGVCISGGEPTLSDGLEEFLGKIKELGYAVKLDTNGSRPKIVKHLAEAGLIDKVAMDIKACPDNYGNLTGIEKPDMDSIFETADFLLHGNLDYEFRTTVKNTDDVDSVCSRFLYEVFYNVICVWTVSKDVLSTEKHLKFCVFEAVT